MWVYEEADDTGEPNLYVHHDVMLPAFPLSLAWMDCSPSDPSQTANLAAVSFQASGMSNIAYNGSEKSYGVYLLQQI